MHYMGGKHYISRNIAEIINNKIKEQNAVDFVSLFCGACSIESKIIVKNKILNDNHEYLMAMFNGIQNGYELPDIITEEQYKYIKNNKDEDKILSGFIGFASSFAGKWFSGYAKSKKTIRGYTYEGKKSLIKKMIGLNDSKFVCNDYHDIEIPIGAIIYADPPYANTTGYGKYFDTNLFWEHMRCLSKTNIVFISELNAPKDFTSIWERVKKRSLDVNKNNNFDVIEKLFVYDINYL